MDISKNIQSIHKAGGEEQGTVVVSDSLSVLQHCLSCYVSDQAHDITERLQLPGDSSARLHHELNNNQMNTGYSWCRIIKLMSVLNHYTTMSLLV